MTGQVLDILESPVLRLVLDLAGVLQLVLDLAGVLRLVLDRVGVLQPTTDYLVHLGTRSCGR